MAGNIIDDTYDSRDVEEIKSTESLLRNALRAFRTGGDVKKAAELLHDSLEYRAKFRVRGKYWSKFKVRNKYWGHSEVAYGVSKITIPTFCKWNFPTIILKKIIPIPTD